MWTGRTIVDLETLVNDKLHVHYAERARLLRIFLNDVDPFVDEPSLAAIPQVCDECGEELAHLQRGVCGECEHRDADQAYAQSAWERSVSRGNA